MPTVYATIDLYTHWFRLWTTERAAANHAEELNKEHETARYGVRPVEIMSLPEEPTASDTHTRTNYRIEATRASMEETSRALGESRDV